jgi:hypothetical protein
MTRIGVCSALLYNYFLHLNLVKQIMIFQFPFLLLHYYRKDLWTIAKINNSLDNFGPQD